MSFDYLKDIFGRFRKPNKTKYTDIECRAVSLLKAYSAGKIAKDEFGDSMAAIGKEFNELMFDKEQNAYVFDENTPGWLNMFLGNKFAHWNKVRLALKAARQNPQMLADPRWPELERMERREDAALLQVIRSCLEELK